MGTGDYFVKSSTDGWIRMYLATEGLNTLRESQQQSASGSSSSGNNKMKQSLSLEEEQSKRLVEPISQWQPTPSHQDPVSHVFLLMGQSGNTTTTSSSSTNTTNSNVKSNNNLVGGIMNIFQS